MLLAILKANFLNKIFLKSIIDFIETVILFYCAANEMNKNYKNARKKIKK